ncbi:hypothetical protein [Sulfurisphaera ohwakuensis]|uniref:hypothetical protein n=1 Tax=Sulfurisphaera ohwakuensis TaxID=69656 RepID=UPI0036F3EABB
MDKESLSKLMMYYADLVSVGTLHYLVELMAEKEGVSKREMFERLGISRGTLYQKSVGIETREKIIEEAFKRLDTDKVVEVLYESVKAIYINFLIDILSAYDGKETKTIVEENLSLLSTVRDLERRQIVEQLVKKGPIFKAIL